MPYFIGNNTSSVRGHVNVLSPVPGGDPVAFPMYMALTGVMEMPRAPLICFGESEVSMVRYSDTTLVERLLT
jgi:hypothetical protein